PIGCVRIACFCRACAGSSCFGARSRTRPSRATARRRWQSWEAPKRRDQMAFSLSKTSAQRRAAADHELEEFRALMEAPKTFEDGFSWTAFLGALFVALLMV